MACIQFDINQTTCLDCHRFSKWRERKSRVDKDVRRIDSSHPFYAGEDNPNTETLRQILLTYSMYNFDLGYCQVHLLQEDLETSLDPA